MDRSFVAAVALVSMTLGGHVQAGNKRDACEADASRFCKDAIPDEAKIGACLQANHGKLSAACRKSFDARSTSKGM